MYLEEWSKKHLHKYHQMHTIFQPFHHTHQSMFIVQVIVKITLPICFSQRAFINIIQHTIIEIGIAPWASTSHSNLRAEFVGIIMAILHYQNLHHTTLPGQTISMLWWTQSNTLIMKVKSQYSKPSMTQMLESKGENILTIWQLLLQSLAPQIKVKQIPTKQSSSDTTKLQKTIQTKLFNREQLGWSMESMNPITPYPLGVGG